MRIVLRVMNAVTAVLLMTSAHAQEPSRADAEQALEQAITFFNETVSTEGGYLWRYSADLALREGEGRASETQSWVQPPGTPSVGMAILEAYEATGDEYYLDAAQRTAHALVRGQLQSGGWDYRLEENPAKRDSYAFRTDDRTSGHDRTTLDDNTTQAALQCLMRVDRALDQSDAAIHEAAMYALDHLLAAQFPNGAWPQRFVKPIKVDQDPGLQASYPESWSREYVKDSYMTYYTFNDNTMADMIETMIVAHEVYGDDQYLEAAKRGGDFIRKAQMPEPQPAWAQQYNPEMHPVWARKFEPPAITGGESQGAMMTLIHLARETGESRFLQPVPRAIAYFRESTLPDGRLARFYELETNKPLYFTMDYELTYSSDDMPTHYAFIVGNNLDAIEQAYDRVAGALSEGEAASDSSPSKPDAGEVREIIAGLDDRGAWVTEGSMRNYDDPDRVIDSRDFISNVRTLCRYIEAMN